MTIANTANDITMPMNEVGKPGPRKAELIGGDSGGISEAGRGSGVGAIAWEGTVTVNF